MVTHEQLEFYVTTSFHVFNSRKYIDKIDFWVFQDNIVDPPINTCKLIDISKGYMQPQFKDNTCMSIHAILLQLLDLGGLLIGDIIN